MRLNSVARAAERHADANDLPQLPVVATTGASYVVQSILPRVTVHDPLAHRRLRGSHCPSGDALRADILRARLPVDRAIHVAPSPFDLITAFSPAAEFSNHWLPQEAALTYATTFSPAMRGTDPFRSTGTLRLDDFAHSFLPVVLNSNRVPLLFSELPQRPSISEGRLRLIVYWRDNSRFWSNLVLLQATTQERGIYLYVRNADRAIFLQFFGATVGPIVAPELAAGEAEIELRWQPTGSQLKINGRSAGEVQATVPPRSALRFGWLGWLGESDLDRWAGEIRFAELRLGTTVAESSP